MTESRGQSVESRHALVLGLVLLAFTIRLYQLEVQSIWWDEAISIHLARASVKEIVFNRAGNLHPPLYFFLLKLWRLLVGDSPFSARFLSVWFGLPLIPGLYLFGRRWFSPRAGLIAATLAAISPVYLVYSQETRVYALLPLAYVALLALRSRLSSSSGQATWRVWVLFVGVEVVTLGLHYVSLFAIGYITVTLLMRFRNRRAGLIRVLMAQGAVVLLLSPWLLVVLRRLDALQPRLQMTVWQAEPVGLMHFVRLLWTFQMTGLPSLIADPVATWLAAFSALGLFAALVDVFASSGPNFRSETLRLALDWLVPLASAFIIWRIRPLSHPRYVVMFTPALLLVSAGVFDRLVDRSPMERVGAALLALSVLSTFALGIHAYFADFTKDDTRGAADAIATRSAANDLVLVPPEDWSIPYYYDGPAPIQMVWPGDARTDWRRLAELTAGVDTVFLFGYDRGSRDPRSIITFALEMAGDLVERWKSNGVYVKAYDLHHAVMEPSLAPVEAQFGPLRLNRAWIEQGPPADTAITVSLDWRLEESVSTRLKVSLDMQDTNGWTWANTDDWLLSRAGLLTDRWRAGEVATTYHIVPLPPGTPPVTYALSVGVYGVEDGRIAALDLLDEAGNPKGQLLDLGVVALSSPMNNSGNPYRVVPQVPAWDEPIELDAGIVLVGASLDRESIAPGESLFVNLRWQSKEQIESVPSASLLLRQGDPLTAETITIGGRYPATRWSAGQVIVEHRRLLVPAVANDGHGDVVLHLDERSIVLGRVEIEAREHLFEPPPMAYEMNATFDGVASLLGYDLSPGPYFVNQPITVTLYWRALEGATSADYTVFAHVLDDDGGLVGQHDGRPVAGTRPSQSWIPGEIIVDRHSMVFRTPYAGPAAVEVGLYRSRDLERVPTEAGGSSVLLPMSLTITER